MTWSFHWLFFGGIMLAGMSMGLHLSRRRFDCKNSLPFWLHVSVYISAFLIYMGTLVRYQELVGTEPLPVFAALSIAATLVCAAMSTALFFGIFRSINRLVAVYHRFANE